VTSTARQNAQRVLSQATDQTLLSEAVCAIAAVAQVYAILDLADSIREATAQMKRLPPAFDPEKHVGWAAPDDG
jgi:hypothetical protein